MPDTHCAVPGGGNVFYPDPQLTCPLCDPKGWGAFMNENLFPESCNTQLDMDSLK